MTSTAHPVAATVPYVARLPLDLAEKGHVTGHVALAPGKRRVIDGPDIDIPVGARLSPARVPVNPCKGDRFEPGLVAYCNRPPVVGLPYLYPSHMRLKKLHLNQEGKLYVNGKLGSARMPLLPYTKLAKDLQPYLDKMDSIFQETCAQITAHPVLEACKVINFDKSDLTFELPGGPHIEFDAEGRLPFKSVRVVGTRISAKKAPAQSRYAYELKYVQDLELMGTDDKPYETRVDLAAMVGPATYRRPTPQPCRRPDARQPTAPDAFIEAAPAAAEAATQQAPPAAAEGGPKPLDNSKARPYTAAIFAALLDRLPAEGHLSLEGQRWTPIANFLPDLADVVGNCRIRCGADTTVRFEKRGTNLIVVPDGKLQVTLPEQQIPVRWGWLRRLIASLVVVSIDRVSADASGDRDGGPLPLSLHGTLGLRMGGWTLGRFAIDRDFRVPLPQELPIFRQLDGAAALMAEAYTFSPLVNLSHHVNLRNSDLRVAMARRSLAPLSDDHTLCAESTELYFGALDDDSSISIHHLARAVGPETERALSLRAAVTFVGWPQAEAPHPAPLPRRFQVRAGAGPI